MIINRRKAPRAEKLNVIFHAKLQYEENAIHQRVHTVNNVKREAENGGIRP